MTKFSPGQLVRCVNDDWDFDVVELLGYRIPHKEEVFTVSQVYDFAGNDVVRRPMLALRLREAGNYPYEAAAFEPHEGSQNDR
jgi:hypothetical protein